MNERQQARAARNAEFFEGVERPLQRSTGMKTKTFLYSVKHPRGKLHDIEPSERAELIESGEWFDSPAELPKGELQAAKSDAIRALPEPDMYFIRPDGSDRNKGKENTSKGAFRTLEKALEVINRLPKKQTGFAIIAVGAAVEHVRQSQPEPAPAPAAPEPVEDTPFEKEDSELLAKFKGGGKMTKAELVALGAELGQDDMDASAKVDDLRAEIQAVLG